MDWKIMLAEPNLGEEEVEAVSAVLRSKWLTLGPVTQRFEKAFADKLGVRFAFAVNNGTAALHLANAALGLKRGDEVICPALTFVASANASEFTGASVRFADVISDHDLTVDPASIESLISRRTRAITVVHYAGFPCHMDKIMDIARAHSLSVIEDCAHAPFGTFTSSSGTRLPVGGIGTVGCFSFYGNKNMTTGEGGMVTTNDEVLAERIRLLRSHGMTSVAYERQQKKLRGYDVLEFGFNYRADEIHSAIGLAQLEKIDVENAKRREVFRWYLEELNGNSNVIVPFSSRNLEESTCHIMVIIIRRGYDLIQSTLTDAGIQTSKHYTPIPEFSAYGKRPFKSKAKGLPDLLTLPMSSFLTRDQVRTICSLVNAVKA
jgi:dTDP-4-amino-4,6-dideoxygalactose transaminase